MSCLFWICRGLENLRIEKELRELIWAKDLSVVFLAETWVDEARLKKIKEILISLICSLLIGIIEVEDW